MSRRLKIAAAFTVTLLSILGISVWLIYLRYPDTVPSGQNPVLILPLYDFSDNDYIQGFGQISLDYYHNGFDFGVNDTTVIVSPCNAYVFDVKSNWYNEKGGHWQTNVELRLNAQWRISIPFESWALNSTYGALQADQILVHVGQYVTANQTLGYLLCHGQYAHIHFSVISYDTHVCPYYYLTEPAKAIFLYQFSLVNITKGWDMTA
nr:hypothetical protein [Candidatus Njordarchaeota archaeon]